MQKPTGSKAVVLRVLVVSSSALESRDAHNARFCQARKPMAPFSC